MPTRHPRIQVIEDPELARALRDAAPYLPRGLSRSRQVRELAIVGANQLASPAVTEERRRELLDELDSYFEQPDIAPWDWDLLREGKLRAWFGAPRPG